MELTNELQERFNAQYWAQHLGKSNDRPYSTFTVTSIFLGEIDCLELRPLSSITEEEAIQLYYFRFGSDSDKLQTTVIRNWAMQVAENVAKCSDWARSKGFAVDFMGISVDKMVQAGWIKIKA